VAFPNPFKREQSSVARRERNAQIEKAATSSLRTLATAFTRLADAIERRRLTRAGYQEPERYLKRTDGDTK
jgi:hypothetical protein